MVALKSEFYVNIDAVIAGAELIADTFTSLSNAIEHEMYDVVKQAIYDEFDIATLQANSDDGFPEQFRNHLMDKVRNIRPTVFMDNTQLFVSFDLEEELGGYEDLKKAYHQGALLADGTRLWGPYVGQRLHNEDAEERHLFWEALRYGQPAKTKKGGLVKTEGKWEETVNQYIEIWGDKAPQWLFIQFGQEEWEPTVPQIDMFNNIRRAVNTYATETLYRTLEAQVALANTYKATGLTVGYQGAKAPARVISGTITIGGKTYRPGRFAPRAGFDL